MSEIKILANDGIDPIGKSMLESAGYSVQTQSISQGSLMVELNNFDVIIVRSATTVRKELIDASPNLKIIARGGVGMDNIDVDYAQSKGISVINTPAASSNSVAEIVFAHLLSTIRFLNLTNRVMPDEGDIRFKELKKSCSQGLELYGKTLGIIGLGRIGRETARIAVGMGMNVVGHDPMVSEVEIEVRLHPSLGAKGPTVRIQSLSKEEVLKQCDFLSLHVPGSDEVVIGERELALLPKGAVVVNCARGGVVSEQALARALDSGHIAFACLDVFESEPPKSMDILKYPNVSLSPHIGASTVEAQARIGEELAEKIIADLSNR